MKRIFAVLTLLAAAPPVSAGPFEDATAAYGRANYATALLLFRLLAEPEVAHAQYQLGLMYDEGQSVPTNGAEAMRWYRKPAELGFAPTKRMLGFTYRNGLGRPKGYAEALKWYRMFGTNVARAAVIGRWLQR